MIFLNAPFLLSWENEHDFLKSAFLIFASNVQCRFLPQFISRLFSSHVILSIIYRIRPHLRPNDPDEP